MPVAGKRGVSALGVFLSLALGLPFSSDWVVYVDPSARFSVRYPRGWHIQEDPVDGWVAFYRDRPREGTAFVVFPGTRLSGDLEPEVAVRETLMREAGLGRSADVRLRQRITPQGQGIYTVRGEVTWRGAAGIRMRAVFLTVVARPPVHGGDTLVFYLVLAQAPEREWPRWERTLTEMLRDFKWMGG